MKTLIIVLMAVSAWSAAGVGGDTTYVFRNYVPNSGVDAPVFDGNGTRLSGTNYVAVLFGGARPDSLSLAFSDVTLQPMTPVPFTYRPGGRLDGYFSGGVVFVNAGDCGAPAWLEVRAWDRRLGESYEAVEALGLGGYGASTIFQAQGGFRCANPVPPGMLRGLESFSLRPVQAVRVAIDLYPGLRISGQVGQSYRIEYVPQLQETNQWRFLTNVVLSAPELLWVDPEPARPLQKFYRVIPTP